MAGPRGGVRVTGLQELVRDLERVGVEVDDLKQTFGAIAQEAAGLAASFAPRRTGKLAASIRGSRSKNRATVTAGGARVPYVGAINYGWPKLRIAPSGFMQRADEVMRPRVATDLETAIIRLLNQKGLT